MTDSEALETADLYAIDRISRDALLVRRDWLEDHLIEVGIDKHRAKKAIERLLSSGLFKTDRPDWKFFAPSFSAYFNGREAIYTEYKP